MKRLGLSLMITLLVGCAKPPPPPPPPPPPAAPAPAPFVHRVEWKGQTLEQIARWYTGSAENWQKLAAPVNPDLTLCCTKLEIGREVSIPRNLLVRRERMPTPEVAARAASTRNVAPGKASPKKAKEPTEAPPAGEAPSEAPVDEGRAEEPPPAPLAEAPEAAPVAEAPSAAPIAEAPSPTAGPASGTVSFKGESWNVADAIAYPDGKTVEIALSSKPIDRKEIAKDGKVDSFDVMSHRMKTDAHTITLKVEEDGHLNCIDFSTGGGGGSSCNSALGQALKLAERSENSIRGKFTLADGDDKADVRFGLPITRVVKRAGARLPAGGGDPGRAVLATFAANLSGDFEKIKAVHPPAEHQQMESTMTDAADKAAMLGFLKASTPSNAKIVGGTVEGDSALVDFEGKSEGQKVKGTAEVERVDGKWYVRSVSTQ